MNATELKSILDKHGKWLRGEAGGELANLSGANLSGANLSGADLSWANLSGANLSWANFSRANLSGAIHDSSFAHGKLLAFDWTTYIHQDGKRWLRYGCEHHPVAWWTKNAASAAKMHREDNGDAAVYAKATRGLVAFVNALPGKAKRGGKGA